MALPFHYFHFLQTVLRVEVLRWSSSLLELHTEHLHERYRCVLRNNSNFTISFLQERLLETENVCINLQKPHGIL